MKEYYFQCKQKFLELYQQKLEFLEVDQRTQHEGDKAGARVIMQGVKNGKRRMKNVHQKETTTKRLKQRYHQSAAKREFVLKTNCRYLY